MKDIQYRVMNDAAHHSALTRMMHQLYQEDPAAVPPDDSHFSATLQTLLARPDTGQILLFLDDAETLHGYAILIPYWSNEFGGVILFVDELFVRPDSRGQGLARGLFGFLKTHRPMDARVVALEVSPTNTGARRLYESLGFAARRYTMMTLALR
jgi:GNAT superfamily N-acetyltransferase